MDNLTFTRFGFVINSHHVTWILYCMIKTHMLQDSMNCAFQFILCKLNINSPQFLVISRINLEFEYLLIN